MANIKKSDLKAMSRVDQIPDMHGLSKVDNLKRQMHGLRYDPLLELISMTKDEKLSPALRARIAFECMSYTYPKLRAVQVDPNQGEVININVVYPDKKSGKTFETNLALPPSAEDLGKENPDSEFDFIDGYNV